MNPEQSISTGIKMYSFQYLVPFYEEHAIRQELRHTIDEWYMLHYMERAMEIAVRRIRNSAEMHEADAQAREMRKTGR